MKTLLALVLAVSWEAMGSASAQIYPSRAITAVVPFPAGGPLDTIGRILAEPMRALLGQPVIIDNVGGASGRIGTGRVARATPDGYTLVPGTFSTHVVNGAVHALSYDVLKDFEPVALIANGPQLIVARKAMPANDLKEFIAWLKANPDKASQGTAGTGGTSHLAGVLFQKQTGTRFQFVPYRGSAMQDLVAGNIDLMIDQASNALPQVRSGSIKVYAVASKTRMAAAPDIPTAERPDCLGSIFRTGLRFGRPRARRKTSWPGSMQRPWRLWPTQQCGGDSAISGWRFSRASSRRRKCSRRSTRPRSRSGGRSSRRRASRRSDPAARVPQIPTPAPRPTLPECPFLAPFCRSRHCIITAVVGGRADMSQTSPNRRD